jgi:RimJ/RimL family protein N-acetyltransferase
MNYVKKLEGEKVIFAPVEKSEARKYMAWYNDFEIGFFLGTQEKLITEDDEIEAIERLSKAGYLFVVLDKETKTPIGNCGIHQIDWVNRTAEIGVNIGNKSYWNKGFGTEATILLLAFAFHILNLNNVMLRVLECNPRAIHIYEKLGFTQIGRRRQVVTVANENFDMLYYDMLASDFDSDIIRDLINKYKSADKNLNKISLM